MGRILVAEVIHEAGLELIAKLGHEAVLPSKYNDQRQVEELIKTVDALIVRILPVSRELMDKAPNLRVIGKHGVGVDNIDVSAATEKGIQVVFTPGASSQAVAEHTITLMLSVAKKITTLDKEVCTGNYWIRNKCQTIELSNKTLGLIGSGRIGSIVGQMCHNGFNMRVLIYDPYLKDTTAVEPWGLLVDSLDEMIPQCDFVSVHCPLTKETKGLVNKNVIDMMKKTAILVNAARGPIVNQKELYRALKDRRIAGAGLDVFEVEPPEQDDPLLRLDNAVLTPHVAAGSEEAMQRVAIEVVMNVTTFLDGSIPQGMVNRI